MGDFLPAKFFSGSTLAVAENLLGKFLVRRFKNEEKIFSLITEVEAYDGPKDKASHASRGRTSRNLIMFGPPGRWYVYFIYGRHWMLNIVTGSIDYPAAVLLRGTVSADGPARLTKKFKITKTMNNRPAVPASGLWFEDRDVNIPANEIVKAPRVGVSYAGEDWANRPYRFIWSRLNQSAAISKMPKIKAAN